MSPSLHFEMKRDKAPFAEDSVERATWAEFKILVAGRCVTEFQNEDSGNLEQSISIPLFSIAEWVVRNWWALLYEPCRGETPPRADAIWSSDERNWLARHCMQAADTALVLPFFHLFSNGPQIAAVWDEETDSSAYPQYWSKRALLLDRTSVEEALRIFVSTVLDWCDSIEDGRVSRLQEDWKAIRGAGAEERDFCEASGRMGLDPYCVHEWPSGLQEFLAGDFGTQLEAPMAGDFLDATEPSKAPELWKWVCRVKTTYGLTATAPRWENAPSFRTGKDCGYHFAKTVRCQLNLSDTAPVDDLVALAYDLAGFSLNLEDYNHVPSDKVNAVVGWVNESEAMIAGPKPYREDNTRFLVARGLYQALSGCAGGARLLTRASTWDQQAGRAFAAELLAPQEALAQSARSDMDFDEKDACETDLAKRYNVSTHVIRHQLQNQGIWS